jgi:hypothetical protein
LLHRGSRFIQAFRAGFAEIGNPALDVRAVLGKLARNVNQLISDDPSDGTNGSHRQHDDNQYGQDARDMDIFQPPHQWSKNEREKHRECEGNQNHFRKIERCDGNNGRNQHQQVCDCPVCGGVRQG